MRAATTPPIPSPAAMIPSTSPVRSLEAPYLIRILARYARIDPAQEIARLRHSISLLEAYVFPNQRPSVPHRRTSDAASLNVIPKKEYIDLDVHGEKTHAPGMLGTHTQGGLYAGPTSAATHLLMVG